MKAIELIENNVLDTSRIKDLLLDSYGERKRLSIIVKSDKGTFRQSIPVDHIYEHNNLLDKYVSTKGKLISVLVEVV